MAGDEVKRRMPDSAFEESTDRPGDVLVRFTIKELLNTFQTQLIQRLDSIDRKLVEMAATKTDVQVTDKIDQRLQKLSSDVTILLQHQLTCDLEKKRLVEEFDEERDKIGTVEEKVRTLQASTTTKDALDRYKKYLIGVGLTGIGGLLTGFAQLVSHVKLH